MKERQVESLTVKVWYIGMIHMLVKEEDGYKHKTRFLEIQWKEWHKWRGPVEFEADVLLETKWIMKMIGYHDYVEEDSKRNQVIMIEINEEKALENDWNEHIRRAVIRI